MHLMPNVVHDVQLLAVAPQLMSAHKEVHKKSMHLILVGMLGVDGVAVDAIHDVMSGEEVMGTSTHYSPGKVEVGHLVLAHRLVLEVDPEVVDIIAGELIAKAPCKLIPSGLRHVLIGHPLDRTGTGLFLEKHHGGIELTYHLLGEVVRECHQRNKPLLFTYLECFPKVFGLRLELFHVDGELRAKIELL